VPYSTACLWLFVMLVAHDVLMAAGTPVCLHYWYKGTNTDTYCLPLAVFGMLVAHRCANGCKFSSRVTCFTSTQVPILTKKLQCNRSSASASAMPSSAVRHLKPQAARAWSHVTVTRATGRTRPPPSPPARWCSRGRFRSFQGTRETS
jgi:hypothetical protein